MSINDQLVAYRAKKAAQKEAESKDNSSIFTKTFSVLRSRSKTKEGGQGMTQTQSHSQSQEDTSHTEKIQKNDSVSDVTQPPTSSDNALQRGNPSPNSDKTSPHRDLLTPNAGPRHGLLSRFLLHDGRILNGPRILKGILWLILWGLFIELQFGCVYFIVSLFYFVYTSMESGTRDKARPSAYSVFNENCERIDGTFTTEQFEKELRYGAMSVH